MTEKFITVDRKKVTQRQSQTIHQAMLAANKIQSAYVVWILGNISKTIYTR